MSEPMTQDVAAWREYTRAEAEPHGLAAECLLAYDHYVSHGFIPQEACWCALYDWDI